MNFELNNIIEDQLAKHEEISRENSYKVLSDENVLKEISERLGYEITLEEVEEEKEVDGEIKKETQYCIKVKADKKNEYTYQIEEKADGTQEIVLNAINDTPHKTHTPNIAEPTCVEDQKCKICGILIKEKLGHIMGEYEVAIENGQPKNPTCELDGEERSYCQRVFANGPCGYYESRPIKALGHVWAETYTVDVTPTCTTEGSESKHCTREGCNAKTDERAIAANGHQFGEWTTTQNANCGKDGQRERTCSVCGYKETESISKFGNHTFGDWVVTSNPTCTSTGTKTRTCSVCSYKDTESIPTTDHSWTATTVLIDGNYHGIKCQNCGTVCEGTKAGHYCSGTVLWTYDPLTHKSSYHVESCGGCGCELNKEHEAVEWVLNKDMR